MNLSLAIQQFLMILHRSIQSGKGSARDYKRGHMSTRHAHLKLTAHYLPAKFTRWCDVSTMKTSYEPARLSAYSDDLRWRMVYQRMALGYTFDQI